MTAQRTSTCRICARPLFDFVAKKTGGLCRGCAHKQATENVAAVREQEEREADRPLTHEDFEMVCQSTDLEAACHLVFGKAHSKWSKRGPSALTIGERTLLAVETFFGETCNGGVDQYLGNESGKLTEDLPEALLRVGLTSYVPLAIEIRQRQRTMNEDALDDLTNRFFELYDEHAFRRALFDYIRNHEDEFV
jgi:hypothetical protein